MASGQAQAREGEQEGAVRVVTAIVFVALLTGVTACGQETLLTPPPRPSVLPPPPAPPPPAPGPPTGTGLSAAVLVMSNLRVTVTPALSGYAVQFLLSEVSGKSGATITNVRSSTGSQTENTGPSCWRDVIRVAPGGTLDTFDAGWDALAYCAPGVLSPASVSSVSVLVSYVDDEGRAGSVEATVTVSR